MKKKVYRQRKMQTIGSNYIDPATTYPDFGKKTRKRSKGVAGKGGKTTNSVITEKMFQKELAQMKEENNA